MMFEKVLSDLIIIFCDFMDMNIMNINYELSLFLFRIDCIIHYCNI